MPVTALGVAASTVRRPRALGGRCAADFSRQRAAACWLGRRLTAGAAGGRFTRSRPVHPGGAADRIRVRLGVVARPRPPAPDRINRPVTSTTGETRHPRPAVSIAAAAHAGGRCHVGRRAPLLRFSGPFSACWPRRVLVRRAAGPPDSSRFDVASRHPRRLVADLVARLALAGLRSSKRTRRGGARGGGRAGAGVAAGSGHSPLGLRTSDRGRRPVAGSRRRGDRAVRGRPGHPGLFVALTADPSTASAAASHPPPAPGHAPPPSLARCSATRPHGPRCAAWSDELVLPSSRPTALLGFRSSPALRRFAPAEPGGRHVSVRPGPRAVRAFPSAPIDFRRGDLATRRVLETWRA